MKFVYLASAYTHPSKRTRDSRATLVTKVAAKLKLKHKNVVFFLPITQSHAMKKHVPELGFEFKHWAKDDLYVISEHSDEVWVVMSEGWKESVGVTAEIQCAQYLKKKIVYIDPKTLKKSKHP